MVTKFANCIAVMGYLALFSYAGVAAASPVFQALPESQNPKLSSFYDLGPADESVSMNFVVVLLDRYNGEATDPNSPYCGHMFTPAEYCQKFGPAPRAVARMKAYYKGFGLKLTNSSCFLLSFTGTVPEIDKAFGTSIHTYRSHFYWEEPWDISSGVAIANSTPLLVPAEFFPIITGIEGLDRLPNLK